MLEKKEKLKEEDKDNQSIQETSIKLWQIHSFEYLFDLLKTDKYTIKQLSNDLKNFCIESEKNNYICEKNEEFKLINEEHNFLEKFNLCKNRFDFQINMSDLLISFFKFVKNNKPNNKKEYSLLKQIFLIFNEIKNNNLLMEDIQCLVEYGVLKDYNNSFNLLLFDINENNIIELISFFNLKNYFLSNINHINTFIFKFNELINSVQNEKQLAIFVRKLATVLSGIINMLNGNNKDNSEIKHKKEIYKEKIINSINKEKMFELFFSDKMCTSHLDILLNL